MGNRIYTAPEVLEARVDAAIQALNALYGKKETLRGLGEGLSAKVKLWRDRLTLQRNTPFTITVCGEFKRGKSTFINALLGEEVVPTDILPETCTVNRLLYGPHRNEAALSDGRRMQLLDDELCRERIQQRVSENGEPFLNITLYRPLEMLRDIMIVDTPGLNDTEDFNGQVMDMVAQSDAVIYLFSAETPLSLHEQLFLRNVVLPIEGVDLFAICNFMDRLPASEIDRFVHMTKERMDLVLPNQEIWAVSALDECCRIEGVERPNPQSAPRLEETFDRLRERLEKYKSLKHEIAISDRNERILNAIRRDLRVELEKTRAILTEERDTMAGKIAGERENLDHLAEKVGAIPERIAACAMEMKDEARGWFSELLDRVESDIPSLEKIDREIIIKYYSFYCTDLLEEAWPVLRADAHTETGGPGAMRDARFAGRKRSGRGISGKCGFERYDRLLLCAGQSQLDPGGYPGMGRFGFDRRQRPDRSGNRRNCGQDAFQYAQAAPRRIDAGDPNAVRGTSQKRERYAYRNLPSDG